MVKAVDNDDNDFNTVFDTYFDRDNYLSWLATNILFGNIETANTNNIIYSPSFSNTWYFIPWDCDGAFKHYKDKDADIMPDSMYGINMYWQNRLHERFFSIPGNAEALDQRMQLLLDTVITPENTYLLTNDYKIPLQYFAVKLPDIAIGALTPLELDTYLNGIYDQILVNRQRFLDSMKYPTPVQVDKPILQQDGHLFVKWSDSFDFQNDDITYRVQLATDPQISDVLADIISSKSELLIRGKYEGTYYLKVTAVDAEGNIQYSTDQYYSDFFDKIFYGVKECDLS